MAQHVVIGAGPVGGAVARQLAEGGADVLVVTRRGTSVPGAEGVAADAKDGAALTRLAAGAQVIYNCVNPPYRQAVWQQDWPPIHAAMLAAAEANGAVLAITAPLYAYGKVDAPITEDTPLNPNGPKGEVRARMWTEALQAHQAGRVRVVEVRASDYLGGNSLISTIVAPALKKGSTAFLPGDLNAPHTWTSTEDTARLLIAAAADESALGRAWHVPSVAPVSVNELSKIAAQQLGTTAKVRAVGPAAFWLAGLVNADAKELRETQYQFRGPFVLDSTAAQQHFGQTPTPLQDSVRLDLVRGGYLSE